MMNRSHALVLAMLTFFFTHAFSVDAEAQPTSQGPAQGTSGAGVQQNTGSFATFPGTVRLMGRKAPKHAIPLYPDPPNLRPAAAPLGSNEQDDLTRLLQAPGQVSAPGLISNFQGPGFTGFIPPDPIVAVGPNHIMPLVNSDFHIYDKTGTLLQTIDAEVWYNGLVANNGAFDPKIIYDHFADRWVMVWLSSDFSTFSWILVSVSDDADPNGAWCNWALQADLNGSTAAGNAADYQGLGYDQNAVYVVPNQFNFSTGFFDYAKIRILPKTTLYDDLCPAIAWTDFWDLRDPDVTAAAVATVRPALTFGAPGVEYLMNDSPFLTGTTMTVWTLANPVGPTPTLTAQNVAVTTRELPPDADQMGSTAGSTDINIGGPRIRNVVYRGGSLWTAHSVADASGQFARARYVRIDVSGAPSVLEDVSFGSDNCWLYYPAITADVNSNMTMVYSQSCTNEFAGVHYTGRATTDPGVQPSALLKAGEAFYELVDGSGRNRWGDYSGIAVDPVDDRLVWIYGEYAETPGAIDLWGTWVGQVSSRAIGDANDDGNVDVADVTLVVEYVLEITPLPVDPLDFTAADCAANANIDIGDIVCITDIILSPIVASAAVPIGAINPAELRLTRAGDDHPLRQIAGSNAVMLEADVGPGIAGLQARIKYDPTRVRLRAPVVAEGAAGFVLASNDLGGELLLVLYNPIGRTLDPGEGPLVWIPFEEIRPLSLGEDDAIELVSVLLADRGGNVASVAIGQASLVEAPPTEFRLSEPYPNPVGSSGTRLELEIPLGIGPSLSGARGGSGTGSVRVQVEVYNVRGQLVRKVMDEPLRPGRHSIQWDGRTDNGAFVSSGLYVMRVIAGSFNETRKLIVATP